MAVTDDMINSMVAEDQPLVPRVDKYVGTKRAGMGSDNLPIFKNEGDAEMFLEAAGFVSPTAEMIRGVKMMTEGDLLYGAGTVGFGAIGGATLRGIMKGSKAAIKNAANIFKKNPDALGDIIMTQGGTKSAKTMYGGHLKNKEKLMNRVNKAFEGTDKERITQLQQNQQLLAKRRAARTRQGQDDKRKLSKMLKDRENVVASKTDPMRDVRIPRDLDQINISKLTGETKAAAYKAEEFFQRTKLSPELEKEFVRQARQIIGKAKLPAGSLEKVVQNVRRNYLLDDAVSAGAMTNREASLYANEMRKRGSFEEGTGLLEEVKSQVRQSLHAEDLSKAGLGVEITPKGVRATPATHPIDLLPK
tara:strand:- start:74 stop:1156 length:1083 start_codon:yes stop_codon:yes gene_type:complete